MDTAANGADRNTDLLGDLVIGQPGEIAQHDRLAELIGQCVQRILDVIGQRDHRQRLVGRRTTLNHPVRIIGQMGLRPPLAAAGLIEKDVGHDTSEPSMEGTRDISLQTTLHPQERLLDNVLGIGLVPGESIRD